MLWGIPLPLDQVLTLRPPLVLMIPVFQDLLNVVFWNATVIINDWWRWVRDPIVVVLLE
jgi:hypothetical protein